MCLKINGCYKTTSNEIEKHHSKDETTDNLSFFKGGGVGRGIERGYLQRPIQSKVI